jgi:predicted GNAT family N-acyltransferase
MIQFDYKSSELFYSGKSYKLSSVLGEDNFYFGLFELPTGIMRQAKFITGLPKNFFLDSMFFNGLLEQESLLNSQIIKASFAYQSPYFTIIPDFITVNTSDQEMARDISALCHDERFRLNKIPLNGLDSSLCFMESVSNTEILYQNFPSVSVTHLNAVLYNKLKLSNEQILLVHIYDQSVQTLLLDQGKLIQTNDYQFRSESDILYYILLNLKNSQTDPSLARVMVSGMIRDEGYTADLLRKHLRFVEFVDLKKEGQYSNVFLGKQKSYFFSLECLGYEDHQR